MSNYNNLGDLINQIKIAISLNLLFIFISFSKFKYNLLNLFWKNFYIKDFLIFKENKKIYILIIFFNIKNKFINSIQFLKLISKPSLRIYKSYKDMPKILNGLGLYFISTNIGLITDHISRKLGIGGELICYVF